MSKTEANCVGNTFGTDILAFECIFRSAIMILFFYSNFLGFHFENG